MVIQAATKKDKDYGSVEPGKIADLSSGTSASRGEPIAQSYPAPFVVGGVLQELRRLRSLSRETRHLSMSWPTSGGWAERVEK
jgi:hypothetical protein